VDQGLGDEGAAVGPEVPAGIGLVVFKHGDLSDSGRWSPG